ncbi:MAG: hypothetical protein WC455_22155 [Dehalococcoidia bacterium]
MTRGQIESELRTYREKSARLAVLRARAVEIEHKIIELRARAEDPSGVGAAVLDGMPHVKSGTSVVERQAILGEHDTDEIRDLQHELERVNGLAYEVGCEVARVEAWIMALSERERFVIKAFYFDGLFWGTIRRRYEDEYKMPLSERQMKRLRIQAIEKIERVSV